MNPEPVPPRTFANRADVGLVLLVSPAGDLLAENMAGRVKCVRYANSPDPAQGCGPAHKRLTPDQLAAVRDAMNAATRCGKPFLNDWTPTPPPPWWHPLEAPKDEKPCTASTSLPTPPPPCPSDTPPTPPPSS